MPRRTYGVNRRRRPSEQNGSALARLEQQMQVPAWQRRREEERAGRLRNQPVRER